MGRVERTHGPRARGGPKVGLAWELTGGRGPPGTGEAEQVGGTSSRQVGLLKATRGEDR